MLFVVDSIKLHLTALERVKNAKEIEKAINSLSSPPDQNL